MGFPPLSSSSFRVWRSEEGRYSPDLQHMAAVVHLDGDGYGDGVDFLVDVGWAFARARYFLSLKDCISLEHHECSSSTFGTACITPFPLFFFFLYVPTVS